MEESEENDSDDPYKFFGEMGEEMKEDYKEIAKKYLF